MPIGEHDGDQNQWGKQNELGKITEPGHLHAHTLKPSCRGRAGLTSRRPLVLLHTIAASPARLKRASAASPLTNPLPQPSRQGSGPVVLRSCPEDASLAASDLD